MKLGILAESIDAKSYDDWQRIVTLINNSILYSTHKLILSTYDNKKPIDKLFYNWCIEIEDNATPSFIRSIKTTADIDSIYFFRKVEACKCAR